MGGEHSCPSLDRAPQRASTNPDIPCRQLEAQPHTDNATLKRKHEGDHESSRMQRVGRFPSKEPFKEPLEEPLKDAPQEDVPSAEKESEVGESQQENESDNSLQQNSPSHWRAILSFHGMIRDAASAGQIYDTLNAEQKLIIALGVRNLFLATSARKSGAVRDRDRDGEMLEHMQCVVGDVADPAVMRDSGLRVSFYPNSKYTKLRHFQDLDAKIGEHPHRNYFAQVVKTPRVFAAFVEGQE
ncbi:hypothetical protein E4U55_006633 [Claviceps digitariae]|nr:hypothetical protein E4U55_006633 [Claviceps digitariae]